MIDINELRRLAQAVSGWSNCNQAWLDQSEDVQAAVVGHIDEDGNTYPVATIDCDQYCAAHQSLPLAKFYAAANPAAISELIDRLEAAESDAAHQKALADSALRVAEGWEEKCNSLRAKIAEMERQEPLDAGSDVFRSAFEAALKAGNWPATRQGDGYRSPSTQIAWRIAFSTVNRLKLYLAPGAQGEGK